MNKYQQYQNNPDYEFVSYNQVADNGLSVEGNKMKAISPSTIEFGGQSHEDGGTQVNYQGNPIEVEKGETGHVDNSGNLIIAGNMQYPGTNKKFKTISKEIADKENKVNKVNVKASNIATSVIDPTEKFDMLKSNSAQLMQQGSAMKLQELAKQKEHMAMIQQAMLDTAHQFNLDPQEMSKGNIKKAKNMGKKSRNGAMVAYYADGGTSGPGDKGTRSDRNNNPGNIRYGAFAKRNGATGQDKDGFAIFPSKGDGSRAMKTLLTGSSYNNLSVNDAINKWTAGSPYNLSGLSDVKDKRISDLDSGTLNRVLDYMTKGEGTKYPVVNTPSNNQYETLPPIVIKGRSNPPSSGVQPYKPQMVSSNTVTPMSKTSMKPILPASDNGVAPVETSPFTTTQSKVIPSNKENLDISQLYPEMYTAATNALQPVRLQQYNPQLLQPYQVSFQDRLNENNASFKSMENLVDYNPTALSTLAGQKYGADSSVLADEFRQNDSQNRGIYNTNINTLNNAEMTNLQLADQQYTRQAEAKSKTKATDQAILNSVASKYAQNKLENRQLQAAESYSGFRFNPDSGQIEWMGPDASFRGGSNPAASNTDDGKITLDSSEYQYDRYGNLIKRTNKQKEQQARTYQKRDGGSVPSLYSQIYGKHR